MIKALTTPNTMDKIKITFLIFTIATLLFSCESGYNSSVEEKNLITFTQENFSDETNRGIVLVDFWATWCMPCRAMAPIIEKIGGQTTGKVKIGKVDVDAQPKLSNRFGIQSIPTILILKDGKEMERFVGVTTRKTLTEALGKYVTL
jgi:thioredoxin 1